MIKDELTLDLWRYDIPAVELVVNLKKRCKTESRALTDKELHAINEGVFNIDRAISELKLLKKSLQI